MITVNSHDFKIILTTAGFLLSLISTAVCIPIVNKIGLKYKIFDEPDSRKQHKDKIVRLGGLGILFGMLTGILLSIITISNTDSDILNHSIISIYFIGSICFFSIGLIDDIYKLNPLIRLIYQIILSSILYINGVSLNAIDLTWFPNLGVVPIPSYLCVIITIIWLVGVTNAINWIDGLDGLASGLTAIYSIGLILIFISLEKWNLVILTASLSGASIAFLRYNFYPAKILMGDCGSYLLGSSLAIISLLGLTYNLSIDQNDYRVFPFHLALLIFFIPVIDMTFVIFSRVFSGFSPFYPDRRHLHHRILRLGVHHRSTVIIYNSISLIFVTLAVCLFQISYKTIFICSSSILLGLSILYCLNMGLGKKFKTPTES